MKRRFLFFLTIAAMSFVSFAKPKAEQPKYVFYFILDGCGVNTILAT